MFQQLKFNVFNTRWHFLRIVQFVLAVIVLIQAITDGFYLLIIPALFLLYMSLMNTCSACNNVQAINKQPEAFDNLSDVDYTEVK